jgi:hypothetical protein
VNRKIERTAVLSDRLFLNDDDDAMLARLDVGRKSN